MYCVEFAISLKFQSINWKKIYGIIFYNLNGKIETVQDLQREITCKITKIAKYIIISKKYIYTKNIKNVLTYNKIIIVSTVMRKVPILFVIITILSSFSVGTFTSLKNVGSESKWHSIIDDIFSSDHIYFIFHVCPDKTNGMYNSS